MCTRFFLKPFIKINFYGLILLILVFGFSAHGAVKVDKIADEINIVKTGDITCCDRVQRCLNNCFCFCCSTVDKFHHNQDNEHHHNSTYSTPVTSQPTSPVDLSTQDRTSLQAIQKMPAGYEKLKRGKLIYKPNPDNDVGRIEIPFSDLLNPLEGTFDLSRYGDAGKYISIETGYRKEKKADNVTKMEIWIVPRFVVENTSDHKARYLKSLIEKELWKSDVPIGVFWNEGSFNMDISSSPLPSNPSRYLTNQRLDQLSNGQNLLKKWEDTWTNKQLMQLTPLEENVKQYMSSFYLEFR